MRPINTGNEPRGRRAETSNRGESAVRDNLACPLRPAARGSGGIAVHRGRHADCGPIGDPWL